MFYKSILFIYFRIYLWDMINYRGHIEKRNTATVVTKSSTTVNENEVPLLVVTIDKDI